MRKSTKKWKKLDGHFCQKNKKWNWPQTDPWGKKLTRYLTHNASAQAWMLAMATCMDSLQRSKYEHKPPPCPPPNKRAACNCPSLADVLGEQVAQLWPITDFNTKNELKKKPKIFHFGKNKKRKVISPFRCDTFQLDINNLLRFG